MVSARQKGNKKTHPIFVVVVVFFFRFISILTILDQFQYDRRVVVNETEPLFWVSSKTKMYFG